MSELPFDTASESASDPLATLLRERFGFESFRPYQEQVCRAVTGGRDILLVMPTGAGKSLCYQLPGIARAGTTLVISPLIALMEDQVAKLLGQGFRADRVHSGRSRDQSRAACRAYLDGGLDFLFIAPERLRVPGFVEMLARRAPSLIAVDEAHCISQWGHDFRPDYRMLGQRLPMLRPEPGSAPIAALTATATPEVQRDIVEQLGLVEAGRFIHGFRRHNIAVEVVEQRPSLRSGTTRRLLGRAERRPAIVYAPSRQQAEDLAEALQNDFPAAPYHAGLTPARRDEVQAAFLGGELDVVVATIAFGMGIDKPDIRTVIHTALPATVEGYYQEIGRAGRDGEPSRALLLHGYVDRRTHEFFLDRDYPDPADLQRLYSQLDDRPATTSEIAARAGLDEDTAERLLSKLWIHGGAEVDTGRVEQTVTQGRRDWISTYRAQREHKLLQLDQITRFANSRDCRMLHLVRHFGDRDDSGRACATCDICRPDDAVVLRFREATTTEKQQMTRILDALAKRDGLATGRLHRDLFEDSLPRKRFDRLLDGLSRAGRIVERPDSFEREDGTVVSFRRLHLGRVGARSGNLDEVRIAIEADPPAKSRKKKPSRSQATPEEVGDAPPELVDALKAWRISEARRRKVPAYCILHNRTIDAIALARPVSESQLLSVRGVGPALAQKHGERILEIVRDRGTDGETEVKGV